MGAEFNAFTDKEYCCIYADFIDENLPKCIELLLDIVCNPSFHNEHVKTEKNVVLEELSLILASLIEWPHYTASFLHKQKRTP